jgi:hypothetical protein
LERIGTALTGDGRNAAGLSAFNYIERQWAKVTKQLICTVIPVAEEGDESGKSPATLPNLSKSQRHDKDIRVFKSGLEKVRDIISPVAAAVTIIEPEGVEKPFNEITQVERFLTASKKVRLSECRSMLSKFHDMLRHLSRSTYCDQFHPCTEADCSLGCETRKEKCSKEFLVALQNLGGRSLPFYKFGS